MGIFPPCFGNRKLRSCTLRRTQPPQKKGNKDSIPKGKELDQTPGIHRDCSQHPTNGTWNDSQVFLQIQGIKNQSAVGILAFKYNPFLGGKKNPNKQTPQHVQGFTKGILFPIFHSLKTGSTFRCSLNPFFFYVIKSLLFTFSRDFSLSLVRNRSQKLLPKPPFGVFFLWIKTSMGEDKGGSAVEKGRKRQWENTKRTERGQNLSSRCFCLEKNQGKNQRPAWKSQPCRKTRTFPLFPAQLFQELVKHKR